MKVTWTEMEFFETGSAHSIPCTPSPLPQNRNSVFTLRKQEEGTEMTALPPLYPFHSIQKWVADGQEVHMGFLLVSQVLPYERHIADVCP